MYVTIVQRGTSGLKLGGTYNGNFPEHLEIENLHAVVISFIEELHWISQPCS